VREWKEQHSFVGKAPERVTVTAPVHGKPTELDITAELQTACEGLVPPIAETIVDLLSRVEPEFQQRVRESVVLSGCSSLIRGFRESLEGEMKDVGGGRIAMVKDPVFAGSDGGLAVALDAAGSDWEKLTA
jgi:rod shape-determining protein MreB